MSSVYDLHLRSTSLGSPGPEQSSPQTLGDARPGESSGERRLRLLRTVLGELRAQRGG
jgi:hypothetical protein